MNALAPRLSASSAERSSTLPLNMITGTEPWRSWTRRSISQPSIPGIITSRRIRSGDSSSTAESPSFAFPASRTS
jgi:hypothetical protein